MTTRRIEIHEKSTGKLVYGNEGNENYFNMFDEDISKYDPELYDISDVDVSLEKEIEVVQEQRKLEYPSIKDQLDKIYHDGIDAWKLEIKAIKDKYPKPV